MFMAGGTLPDGVNQSYMITEAFGNPAQHYAKGGGVRKVGNREYSLGRNWTNDHRHTNKSEDHEVKYTRKGKFLGIFDGGGDTNNDSLPMSLKKRIDNLKGRVKISKKEAIKAFELHTEKGYGASSVGYELFDAKNKRDSQTFGDLAIDLGRYYSQYEDGGGVKGDRYDGKTEKIVEELKKLKGGLDNKAPKVYQRNGFIYVSAEEGDNYADYDNYLFIDEKLEDFADKYDTYWDWENAGAIVLMPLSDEDEYAKGGGVRRVGNREYSLGRNWTNDHRHVNKGEDHETGYTRKKSFAGGGGVGETPKIYVADLEAYNNGRLSGVWLDLADYNDADELMEAIQDFLNTTGGEEYAIHDAEYIPSSMYSEYMGQRDFEELYEMIDLAKDNNLPLSVVQEVVSQYDASAVEEFQGKYDSEEDFAEQMADEIGFENFSSPEYYVYITDTDRRLLAGEMADSYVDDIRDEDGGNRVIEEAGMDVSEYEEADSDRQEEMLDEAVEIVRDEYYDNWYEGLSDPYYFLVEEQGMYSPDDFFQASFISIDYEKLGRDLEQDYTFIYDDGELYVFNIR
jgi:antirestriction protein